jgi:very-short-patch-repair endonuclease
VNNAFPLPRGEGIKFEGAGKEAAQHQADAERLLWSCLRAQRLAGFKFRHQQAIGQDIVDFVCFDAWLIIEADVVGNTQISKLKTGKQLLLWQQWVIGFSVTGIMKS